MILELTVMTFNLRTDLSEDGSNAWSYRKEKVVKTIRENDPDILGIQEGMHHMVGYLQTSLPEYEMIGKGRDGDEQGEYNAIFYKKIMLNLIDEDQFWLSETPDIPGSMDWDTGCTRICTWGTFLPADESPAAFIFLNTHLDHLSQLAREKGSQLLGNTVETALQAEIPVILAGDFNAAPDNEAIRYLESLGLERLSTEGGTFHNFSGKSDDALIDYIFISKGIQTVEAKIDRRDFAGKYPSDHYPVIGKLEI